jgi:glutathione S-transferase
MITFYDYLPSQNAFKVRLLLSHLQIDHICKMVSIFEGAGKTAAYRRINPTGAVPAIVLDDGRAITESNAILTYLAEGSRYLPDDRYGRAKVHRWLSFEQDCVQNTIGSLRYWTMTSKVDRRPKQLVASKRDIAVTALGILDSELAHRPFICGDDYSIADMSLFAYASRAEEADIALQPYPAFRAWVARVASQPGFLGQVYPYAIDPHSSCELPSN